MSLIASHRGGSLQWPENSPIAFRNTAALPVDQVEFDIHPTADGEIVVIHDATLDRTTNGRGPVASRSLAELRALSLADTDGEHMLTLAELTAVFRPTPIALRMEIKPDAEHRPYLGLLGRALAVLDTAGMRGRTIITSFQAPTVGDAAGAGGIAGAIWLVAPQVQLDIGLDGIAAVAQCIGINSVGLRISHLDAASLGQLRQSGLAVGAWAVNDEAAIRHALGLGVDVFTTDLPSRALALRGQYQTS